MRIFEVTISKQESFTIAAESREALEDALENGARDFDDWLSSSEWEWDCHDPLREAKSLRASEAYPDKPTVPDMALTESGDILSWFDHDGEVLMEAIERTILEHKRRVWQEHNQMKLPGIQ